MKIFKKIIPGLILLDVFLFDLIYVLTVLILNQFNIAFRKWVLILVVIVTVIGGFIGIIQLLLKIPKRGLKITALVLYTVVSLVVGFYGFVLGVFALGDWEHVVEKNGKKYVVYVNGFLDTYATYYDYRSFLTCGNKKRISEYYGDGAFDPFSKDREQDYTPINSYYYDEEGNIMPNP